MYRDYFQFKKNRIHTRNRVFVLNEKKNGSCYIQLCITTNLSNSNLMRAFIKKPKTHVPIILSIKIL